VATYGQIAHLAGIKKNARIIGYALSALPQGSSVPWHRVINRHGEISYSASRNNHDLLQKQILTSEGIVFDKLGKINLDIYLWNE
jgi:methylated-DNA-protein-cysteine methyltransferase-like protein